MVEVERTLVKSPPELWQVLDSEDRMRAWLGRLAPEDEWLELEVTAREPEARLAWKACGTGEPPWVEVTLDKRGWGTHVHVRSSAADAAALEEALDDLGTAHRRPFSRI